jgi:branched-chain amino acid transport system permease protein
MADALHKPLTSRSMKSASPRFATRRLTYQVSIGVGAVGLLVVLPFVATGYQVLEATQVVNYAIALLGLNILLGYNGQLSLGHGAFCALGAYIAFLLMDRVGLSYWGVTPIVAVLCLCAGFLFGLPALRLEGHYLALATFALALAVPQILKHPALTKWTGGFMGVTISPIQAPAWLRLDSDQWLFFFCLLHAVILFAVGWNLMRGGTGRALIALRDNPIAARAMGINSSFYKSAAFGISAMYAGVAGALGLFAIQFASPDSFDLFLSISFVVGVIVGGIATISGAVFGAVFIEFVPTLASEISKSAAWAVYGVALIVFMYLLPRGVSGMLVDARSIVGRKRQLASGRSAHPETGKTGNQVA